MRSLIIARTLACLAPVAVLMALTSASVDGAAAPAGTLQTPSQRFSDLANAQDVSYRRHLIPLLARAGCSARECHGSFQGRGGFQLSLFGSEWEADFAQLTQKKGGEDEIRTNPKEPQKSLILMKPTLQMKHKGKERFKKDSWQYNLILKWIQGGVKDDASTTGELSRLEISPGEIVFARPGESVQLRVLAHWVDGTVEDVTEITRFKTNDESVANVAETGLVSCTGKGDSHIVASYDNGVAPIPVMLAVSEFAGGKFPAGPTHTKIDELVNNKLRKIGVIPSELCTDADFLRRVSIDLTGTLPTPEEITRFLADQSAGKRSAKIEQLLQSPAYVAFWTTKFCDYTGGISQQFHGEMLNNRDEIARQWYSWLYKRVADNMPYDQIAAGIVVSNSRSSPDQSYKDYVVEMNSYFREKNPADYANHPTLPWFWQRASLQNTDDKALAFSHAFLGVRLECAQCHKHPFDLWTRSDFKQFSAFFAPIQVGNRPARDSREICFASVSKEFKESTDEAFAKANPNEVASTELGTGGGKAKVDKSGQTMESAVAREKSEREKSEKARKFMFAQMKQRMETGGLIAWQECYPNFDGMVTDVGSNRRRFADLQTQPKILGAEVVVVPRGTDFRQPLMDWLRSKSNPYFAKAIVNRVWASYFSRGIVDPPDDLNIGNAPSNAELMDYLATAFVAHGYDMKWLHREILNSDTYQRSWQTNPTNAHDTRNFSHAIIRQLPAEVLADAFEMAIANKDRTNALVANAEIRQIGPDGTTRGDRGGRGRTGGPIDQYFLTLFGKPLRAVNCDCERSIEPTLLQTLFTRNDEKLLARIDDKTSWVGALRPRGRGVPAAKIDMDDMIAQVFLRTVSRPPTAHEMDEARAVIASAKDPVDGLRDLLWAMINTREFRVNH